MGVLSKMNLDRITTNLLSLIGKNSKKAAIFYATWLFLFSFLQWYKFRRVSQPNSLGLFSFGSYYYKKYILKGLDVPFATKKSQTYGLRLQNYFFFENVLSLFGLRHLPGGFWGFILVSSNPQLIEKIDQEAKSVPVQPILNNVLKKNVLLTMKQGNEFEHRKSMISRLYSDISVAKFPKLVYDMSKGVGEILSSFFDKKYIDAKEMVESTIFDVLSISLLGLPASLSANLRTSMASKNQNQKITYKVDEDESPSKKGKRSQPGILSRQNFEDLTDARELRSFANTIIRLSRQYNKIRSHERNPSSIFERLLRCVLPSSLFVNKDGDGKNSVRNIRDHFLAILDENMRAIEFDATVETLGDQQEIRNQRNNFFLYSSLVSSNFCKTLMNMRDETGYRLARSDILDELLSQMLVGQSQCSQVMLNTLALVSKSQQGKIFDEVNQLSETTLTSIKNLEKLEELLPFTLATIRESLRLSPPSPLLVRQCSQKIYLSEFDVTLSPSCLVYVPLLSLHTEPAVWGETANSFSPESHFLSNFDDKKRSHFLPFGLPHRRCVAETLVYIQSCLFLSLLVKKVQFSNFDAQSHQILISRK